MIELAFEDFRAKAWASGRPSCIVFYTDGCSICELVVKRAELVEKTFSRGEIAFYKMDWEKAGDLPEKFGVTSTPFVMALDGKSREVSTLSGDHILAVNIRDLILSVIEKDEVVTLAAKFKNFSISMWQVLKHALRRGRVFANEPKQNARLLSCVRCPHWVESNAGKPRCGKCGCFLKLKVKLVTSRCPIGRW